MKSLCRSVALLAVVALGANSTAIQDSVQLRLKFVVGESTRHRMTQSQSLETEMTGEIESLSAFVVRQDVKAVADDGTATLGVSYEAMKMEIGGPASASYDSTRKGEDAKANDARLAKMLEPILAATVGLKMAPSGKVLEVTGAQEMLDQVFGATPDTGPMSVMAMLKEMFNEDALRKMFELNVFPGEPLAPGAKWTRAFDQELPMLGRLKIEFENTFVGVETHADLRCAKIGITGKMTHAKGDEASPIPMEVSLASHSLEGAMFLSLDNGQLIESQIETTLDVHVAATGEAADGLEMDMSMVLTQRMRLLGKDEPAFE